MDTTAEKIAAAHHITEVIEHASDDFIDTNNAPSIHSEAEDRFINNYFVLDSSNVVFLSAKKLLKQETPAQEIFRHVIQKEYLNSIKELDQYIRRLNKAMVDAGIYICKISASGISDWNSLSFLGLRKKSIKAMPGTHSLSFAEWLGRIFFYGFEVIEYLTEDDHINIAVMKTGTPKKEILPARGWLYRMERVGYKGKIMGVYKIRTMYPFSEYLQSYVVKLNGYNDVGKPAADFRITRIGRFLRKYWLDEVPQLFNVLKGEMNLVGVRPLSRARFGELPIEVQTERINFKPGCIPPYVALNMPDSKANIEAEIIYMNDKKKSPYLTDIRYLFKALFNIFTHRIVSS